MPIVSVNLEVDGNSVPVSRGRVVVPVQRLLVSVQRDGFIVKFVITGSLYLDNEVIPGIAQRMTSDGSIDPAIVRIIPNRPDMAGSYPAFMPINISSPAGEMIDVEFDGLRDFHVRSKKVHIIDEMVERGHERLVDIRNALA